MPDLDTSDATLRGLLEMAEKVRAAKRGSATSYLSILSPDMAAAVLRELLETRAVLAKMIEVTGKGQARAEAAAVLSEARALVEHGRGKG